MHSDYFVPNSPEFNRVSDSQFVAFVRLNVVVLVIRHVLHAKPKFFTWCCLFFFCVFDCILVIYPKVVILKQRSCYQLFVIVRGWYHLLNALLVLPHCFKIIKIFLYYIVAVSLEQNYK